MINLIGALERPDDFVASVLLLDQKREPRHLGLEAVDLALELVPYLLELVSKLIDALKELGAYVVEHGARDRQLACCGDGSPRGWLLRPRRQRARFVLPYGHPTPPHRTTSNERRQGDRFPRSIARGPASR